MEGSNPLDPEARRPQGLPLLEVDLGIQVSLTELRGTTVSWPPTRCKERQERFALQHQGSQGDFQPWLDTELFDVLVNPILPFEADILALLLANPFENEDPRLVANLITVVGQMSRDMIRHGKAIVVSDGSQVESLPIRYGWPLVEGGWVWVIPEVSANAQDNRPDTARLYVWRNDTLTGVIREWSGADQLGAVVGVLPAMGVRLATADRAPLSNGWGTPQSDELIHLAVLMARRESGVDYCIDRNERPVTQFPLNVEPGTILAALGDSLKDSVADARALRSAAPSLRRSDVLPLPPGMDPGEMLTWDQNTAASDSFLMRLDARWTEITGFAPIEAADSADVSSGVAIARRNARGVARVAQMHHAILNALEIVLGRPLAWPYVGDSMGQGIEIGTDEVMDEEAL